MPAVPEVPDFCLVSITTWTVVSNKMPAVPVVPVVSDVPVVLDTLPS